MSITRKFGHFASSIGSIPLRFANATKMKQVFLGILIIIAIVGTVGTTYYFQRYNALKSNPNAEAQKQSAALIVALGEHIELPKDETPSVVTIVDKTKLNDQAFFKMAENGDILFAYINTKEAILYRPSTDKIIQVAAINVGDTAATQGISSGVSVAYENGTTTAGLSIDAEAAVKGAFPSFSTVSLSAAMNTDYTTTLVVDISGKHAQEATAIATLLGGTVGPLPEGETAPNADILVISGK